MVRASGTPLRSTMSPRGGSSGLAICAAPAAVGEQLQHGEPPDDHQGDADEQQHHQHQPVIGEGEPLRLVGVRAWPVDMSGERRHQLPVPRSRSRRATLPSSRTVRSSSKAPARRAAGARAAVATGRLLSGPRRCGPPSRPDGSFPGPRRCGPPSRPDGSFPGPLPGRRRRGPVSAGRGPRRRRPGFARAPAPARRADAPAGARRGSWAAPAIRRGPPRARRSGWPGGRRAAAPGRARRPRAAPPGPRAPRPAARAKPARRRPAPRRRRAGPRPGSSGAWRVSKRARLTSPSRNWPETGRGQGQHLVVPLLELGQPAARAELGLQRADVLLGGDDLALEPGEVGALGGDPERQHVAAERGGADGGDPDDGPEAPGDHRDAPSLRLVHGDGGGAARGAKRRRARARIGV